LIIASFLAKAIDVFFASIDSSHYSVHKSIKVYLMKNIYVCIYIYIYLGDILYFMLV